MLAQILADAVTDNLILKNPAAGLPLPKTTRKRPVYLSHEQLDALADAAGANGALVLTLALGSALGTATALRRFRKGSELGARHLCLGLALRDETPLTVGVK